MKDEFGIPEGSDWLHVDNEIEGWARRVPLQINLTKTLLAADFQTVCTVLSDKWRKKKRP